MKKSFKELLNSETPILIDFFAEWCGPCKTLFPVLNAVKKELGDTVKIIKVDVDKNTALAKKYNIMSVPTLLLFKNQEQVWRQSGVVSKQDIINRIKNRNQ